MSTTTLIIPQPSIESPPPADTIPPRVSLAARTITLGAVIVPFIGLLIAIVSLWGWGVGWVEIGLLVVMYLLTGLGITVGFHRLFTHQSFETNRVVQSILGILGSMAVQGPLLKWVAVHRMHHHRSDHPEDPHSPYHHGIGVLGVLRGLWHSHVGWLLIADPPNLPHYIKDLRQNWLLRQVSNLFVLWVILGLVIPTVLGGVLTGSWLGALFGLVWGGLARIFLVHHVTWSVNSICHVWGRQPYRSHDQSRNNLVVGVLAMGEGWHNNHHAFPTSARHGFRWWQFDLSYYVIRALALFGLAWKIKVPAKLNLAAR